MCSHTKMKIRWFAVIPLIAFLMHCGSSNQLRVYQFSESNAFAIMALPPPPEIFSDHFIEIFDRDPLRTALNVGTTIAKTVEAQKVQARLDSAMAEVDIPDVIRERALRQCSETLNLNPIDARDGADYLFIMNIVRYGIEAKSWSASVHFLIDVHVRLVETGDNVEIWSRRVKTRDPVSDHLFGLSDAVGNIITAATLSGLSKEELIIGFEALARHAADRIALRLSDDYFRSKINAPHP